MISSGSYVAQVTAPTGTSGEVALEIVEADTLREGNQRPAFIFMPASRDVPVGGTLTLAATAIGTPNPAYQWSKDGTAIADATNASLTVTNFQAGMPAPMSWRLRTAWLRHELAGNDRGRHRFAAGGDS